MKIVLGTMTFGENVFEPDAKDFISAFFDNGGVELDAAYVYNEGECERMVGRAVKELGRPYKIATKVNPRITGRLDGDAARLQLPGSLERLGMPSVDTVYLHFPDPATPVISVLEALQEFYEAGLFKELGLSNFPAWMVADVWHICDSHGWVKPTVFEGIYNPLTRRAETELDACLDHFGMRFYAYNPMAGGLLTGRYARFEDAPGDGRFTHRLTYKDRYWKKSFFEAVDLLKKAAEANGMTIVEAVYRWLANHSMLKEERGDAIIIGASKLNHLKDNIRCSQAGPLPAELVDAFEAAWKITKGDSPEYFTLYKGRK